MESEATSAAAHQAAWRAQDGGKVVFISPWGKLGAVTPYGAVSGLYAMDRAC
jgi:hypothetical protein